MQCFNFLCLDLAFGLKMAQSSDILKSENKRILEEEYEDTQLTKITKETHKEGLLGKKNCCRI